MLLLTHREGTVGQTPRPHAQPSVDPSDAICMLLRVDRDVAAENIELLHQG